MLLVFRLVLAKGQVPAPIRVPVTKIKKVLKPNYQDLVMTNKKPYIVYGYLGHLDA